MVQKSFENPLHKSFNQYGILVSVLISQIWSLNRSTTNTLNENDFSINQKLIIHHPLEWPTSASFIPSGTMTSVVVKPAYSYTTDRVQRLPPEERDCILPVTCPLYAFSFMQRLTNHLLVFSSWFYCANIWTGGSIEIQLCNTEWPGLFKIQLLISMPKGLAI